MVESITSPHNPRIKLAIQLRDTRQRKKHAMTLIDGLREVHYAAQAGVTLHSVFCSASWLESLRSTSTLPTSDPHTVWFRQQQATLPLISLPEDLMAKITFGERASSLVAIAKTPASTLESIVLPSNPLLLVLDQVEKPGNIGAAARTADAVGASAMILSDPRCELYNPNAIRASMGAIFAIPVASAPASDVLAWLQVKGIQITVARLDASQPYTNQSFLQPSAIVIGSEALGVGTLWLQPELQGVRLPMRGRVDSLNAAVSASVLLYEALRQRDHSLPDQATPNTTTMDSHANFRSDR